MSSGEPNASHLFQHPLVVLLVLLGTEQPFVICLIVVSEGTVVKGFANFFAHGSDMLGVVVRQHGAEDAFDAAVNEGHALIRGDGKLASLLDNRLVELDVGFFAHAHTIGALL